MNLGVLMMSEKEPTDDILKEDVKAENYTINVKVNLKKYNKSHNNLFPHNIRNRGSQVSIQAHPHLDNQKGQDIMVISEEIYQKRISKV